MNLNQIFGLNVMLMMFYLFTTQDVFTAPNQGTRKTRLSAPSRDLLVTHGIRSMLMLCTVRCLKSAYSI